jgi:thiol:disulfide interchange protein DsbD
VVFVDFTADWCITCKVNEGAVLAQPKVDAAFEKHQVVKLKGDWTKKDEEIRQVLESFGKGGVPLYLVYGPGIKEVKVLPEILSQELVVSALDEAAGK